MNYRLIGFVEPSWKHGYGIAGIWLFTFALYVYSSPRVAVIALGVLGVSIALRPPVRCTPFEAAMPIHARDIYCARIVSCVATTWLMNLAAIAGILASSKDPRIAVLAIEMGAFITLGQISFPAVHAEEAITPRWWRFIAGAALAIAIGPLIKQADGTYFPAALTICLLAACGLGSAALFWRTWAALPGSFQIASSEAVSRVRKRKSPLPSFARLPLLRTLFPVSSVGYFFALLIFGLTGTQFFGTFLGVFFGSLAIWSAISRARRGGWLLSLPVSRRKLFLATLSPLASFVLGSVAAFIFSQQTARATVIDSMVVSGAVLLAVAVLEIPSFARRLYGARFFLALAAFLALDYLIWRWFLPPSDEHGIGMAPIELWLGKILPAHLPLLIATAITAVGALYCLAYAGFRSIEPKRRSGARFGNSQQV